MEHCIDLIGSRVKGLGNMGSIFLYRKFSFLHGTIMSLAQAGCRNSAQEVAQPLFIKRFPSKLLVMISIFSNRSFTSKATSTALRARVHPETSYI